jgi:hypothetical protein
MNGGGLHQSQGIKRDDGTSLRRLVVLDDEAGLK